MCGIAGYLERRPSAQFSSTELTLKLMLDAQETRGPDGRGAVIASDGRSGIGHVRLAIIDPTPAADQPFSSDDRMVHIVYNGEIYNYREL
jgi:asparagine synthase (glutamine-hydrolysing)